MRLTTILLLVTTLQVSARSYSQKVTITGKDLSLGHVFELIKEQTGYAFVADQLVIARVPAITLHVKDASLEEVLNKCLRNQQLTYTISDKIIVIASSHAAGNTAVLNSYYTPPPAAQAITGTVSDESGEPLAGVSVRIKELNKGMLTDVHGRFSFEGIATGRYTLVLSSIGFAVKEVTVQVVNGSATVQITLQQDVNKLDETVVKGYYETSRRLNTGNVATVKAEDIAKQPVTDPLAALQGRVPGLFISATNGMPGASFAVTLRGRSSILNGNDPLYVIDGVPYFSEPLDQFTSANGKQSPLSLINPSDIERIDVLKDGDAISIYGSRGSNGVILITTKKGNAGKAAFNFKVYTGGSKVVHQLEMLSTEEYLQMRKEAYANDGVTPTADKAPDLLTWDPTQNTNWQDYMVGNTAKVTDVSGSVSGGTGQTRFLLSSTYHKETTVLAGDPGYQRISSLLRGDHSSVDGKFNITASAKFSSDRNNSLSADITQYYNLPPNYPLYDAGSLYWFGNVQNPQAYLLRTSKTRTTNLVANTTIRYTILPGLNLKASLGYNQTNHDQVQLYPDKTFNPATSPGSMSYFGFSDVHSYIVEPQADYSRSLGKGKLQLLAGATWQQSLTQGRSMVAEGFSSDALMEDLYSAATITPRPSNYALYKYTAVYGRANYTLDDTYILNATFRRDGSTRFGPGRRFGNFGSIGAAWIFTNESFMPKGDVLSFGKLRGSYGTSGNDNVGNYQYLASWSPTSFPYDGVSGLTPSRIPNPDYNWEVSKKLDIGLDLGFFHDKVLLNAGYYRNISDNQLVDYALTPQTGMSSITANFPAKVLNNGWEFELNTTNISGKHFTWKSSLNLTIARNKLLEFPGIESSSYSTTYIVGQSLNIVQGFQFTGVDPATGVPKFFDKSKDGSISDYDDYVVLGKTDPSYYGGFQNNFTYKQFQLDFLFQFVKQEGPTVNYGYLSDSYGAFGNKDLSAQNRWRKSGDITDVPRASLTAGNAAYNAYRNNYRFSSAVWGNASYIRLKNISLRYDLSAAVEKWKIKGASIFVQAQNLITITNYKGFDPETQGVVLPPLKTLTAGLQFSF